MSSRSGEPGSSKHRWCEYRSATGYWIPALRDPGKSPGRSAGMTAEKMQPVEASQPVEITVHSY